MKMLEEGESFSLRAVARGAGVSATAPYRHFADREALESALAVEGFRELKADLIAASRPSQAAELADFGVAYVAFALRRPALFRLMLGPCGEHDVRRQAADDVLELLESTIRTVLPRADTEALATAGWALAHGLAFLHLDGKLPTVAPDEVADRVRSAFGAIKTAADAEEPEA